MAACSPSPLAQLQLQGFEIFSSYDVRIFFDNPQGAFSLGSAGMAHSSTSSYLTGQLAPCTSIVCISPPPKSIASKELPKQRPARLIDMRSARCVYPSRRLPTLYFGRRRCVWLVAERQVLYYDSRYQCPPRLPRIYNVGICVCFDVRRFSI